MLQNTKNTNNSILKVKILFLIIIGICIFNQKNVFAETAVIKKQLILSESKKELKDTFHFNEIGISASTLTGTGLYYNIVFNNKFRLGITGLYVLENGGDSDNRHTYNFGINIQPTLFNLDFQPADNLHIRSYVLFGAGYYADKQVEYKDKEGHLGVGLGLNAIFLNRFSFFLELTYQYDYNYLSKSEKIGLGGSGGIGVMF